MGWNTAGYIFNPVCRELQHAHLWPETRRKILVTLIQTLQLNDWDTEEESLDQFEDDPVVVEAFAMCGVYLWGTPEYDRTYGENTVEEKHARNDEYNSDLGF